MSTDVSIERVAALAQENALPVPSLDLESLASSASNFSHYPGVESPHPAPTRGFSADDPWNVPKFPNATVISPSATNGVGSVSNGAPSSISGTGLPKEWWKKQETVYVNVLGQQGFLLNRYLVYEISTDVSHESIFSWNTALMNQHP